MKKVFRYLVMAASILGSGIYCSGLSVKAQVQPVKPRMQFMGAFDAGQAGASIYKLLDPTEDVVCYVLMPDAAGRRPAGDGKWIYDGNSVGSISCLKYKLPVIPVAPVNQR